MKGSAAAFLLFALAGAPAEGASEAYSCLQTKVWQEYEEGWALRTLSEAKPVEKGKYIAFNTNLFGSRAYLIHACGDESAEIVDIAIYDKDGNRLALSEGAKRDPQLSFTPTNAGQYFVVAHLRASTAPSAEVSVGILYK